MKILIAHDGSEFGAAAVDFAARVVGPGESQVKIVTVLEQAAATDIEAMVESVEELKNPENPAFQKAERLVRVAAEMLREKTGEGGVDIFFEVLAGPAAQKIVEEAETWGADLIVVGSHGRGFWNRVLIGSVSYRVLHHAPCSVLVVRKG